MRKLKASAHAFLWKRGWKLVPANVSEFRSDTYTRHNARRLEHLASLGIPVRGMTVLEVGAGIGDHSHYFIDRECRMVITEAHPENLRYLRHRYPEHDVRFLNIESPAPPTGAPFDLVYCYGLLYHLSNPEQALTFLSATCRKMLFLETCLSHGDDNRRVVEDGDGATEAYSGIGCRPTRSWLFGKLRELFEYVYIPRTQPNHEEFPIDWTDPAKHRMDIFKRAIFVASRERIDNDMLVPTLLDRQTRHV